MKETVIHICTRDRANEVYGLLVSLLNQTYKDFNILIMDDGSGTPITNFYFINYIIQRLKINAYINAMGLASMAFIHLIEHQLGLALELSIANI